MSLESRASTLWTPLIGSQTLEVAPPTATYQARLASSVRTAMTIPRMEAFKGPYDVVGELGQGGMAVVYRARQQVLRREIALKKARDPDSPKFVAEAMITASLEHPNIVPVYDLTNENGVPALAMKLIVGKSWEKSLDARAKGVRDWDTHLDVLADVANAIAFAHAHGVVHCDIKPENVLIGAYGEVLVVDWGIALDFADPPRGIAPPKSALESPCGTPAYLAPELALAEVADIGPATDIYLLGASLYHIATGRAPRDGMPVLDAVVDAAEGKPPVFLPEDDVPTPLQAIIVKAMAKAPADRYATVADFQTAIREYRAHGESLAITELSQLMLANCKARAKKIKTPAERNRVYGEFADTVAAFRQALTMWEDNAEARDGEHAARLEFAQAALDHDDLNLADTQATMVLDSTGLHRAGEGHRARAQALLQKVAPLRASRERSRKVGRALRVVIIAALALIAVGFAVARSLVVGEMEIAEENRHLAEARLDDIRRLSDIKHLADLRKASEALWPAIPANVPDFERWIANARGLVARLPGHRKTLADLDAAPREDVAAQWQHDTLAELVGGIESLEKDILPSIDQRLTLAQSLQATTIDAQRERWDKAKAEVLASPSYAGLKLVPQLGLVPLGADPESGLQEFAALATGVVPTRENGKLQIDEASAVVLVLLPGGKVSLGARPPDDQHPLGTPNVDPNARAHEGPVHELVLDPFFLAKYEVTQAQWLRIEGKNPSAYLPGRTIGGRVVTALHPVEQITQSDAQRYVTKVALILPTEAQWEYAARAGSTTIYPTGDDPRSLAGTLNIADAYCQAHEGPGSWTYEPWLDDGYTSHAPVGRYRANAFGVHDMMGNVWEWASDRVGDYSLPFEPGSGRHLVPDTRAPFVFRGGGLRANTSHARSADRYTVAGVDHRGFDIGMRAARRLEF